MVKVLSFFLFFSLSPLFSACLQPGPGTSLMCFCEPTECLWRLNQHPQAPVPWQVIAPRVLGPTIIATVWVMPAGVQVNLSSMLHLKTTKFGKERRMRETEKYHQGPRAGTGHPKSAVSILSCFLSTPRRTIIARFKMGKLSSFFHLAQTAIIAR